ncbi:MAG: hypothetical protein ACXAB7_09815 [Candidatus Kariarchaeaceae archaeon]|jgi:hypothetical protein
MTIKGSRNLTYGLLALVFLLLSSTLTVARPDNTIYPLTNYFAFNDEGQIKNDVYNQSSTLDSGLTAHSVISEEPVYKFRLIFPTPTDQFDSISLRLSMTFTENFTKRIRWGFLENITISVFPFELGIINTNNQSVQVINALELYRGTTVVFQLNQSALVDLEYFEISFSTWNATSSVHRLEFEQIRFIQSSSSLSSPNYLFLSSLFVIMTGLSFVLPNRFDGILILILLFVLFFVPFTTIIRVQDLLSSLPDSNEGVTRFTFFGKIYEQKSYGNGMYSLEMIKDLSTAFELVASSGTGGKVVYPMSSYTGTSEESLKNDSNNLLGKDTSFEVPISISQEYSFPELLYSFEDITGSPSWWNNEYQYVKQVTITANTALSTNYTIQVDMNTANLVSASKLRADMNDLRVGYYTGSSWVEVDRVVLNNNTAKTSIFFRLQAAIPTSSSDPNYAIYYGYRSGDPGNPPADTSEIFLSSDDFSSGNLDSYSPNSNWTAVIDNTKPTDIGWWSSSYAANHTGVNYADDLVSTGVTTNNSLILVLMKINTSASARIGLVSTAGSDLIALERNSTHISIIRDNGTLNTFASVASALSTELWYMYKFQVVGASLKGKVWPAGGSEPTSWSIETSTGGLPTSGSLVFNSNSSSTLIGHC